MQTPETRDQLIARLRAESERLPDGSYRAVCRVGGRRVVAAKPDAVEAD